MAQLGVVTAFRKRLKSAGYTDISIYMEDRYKLPFGSPDLYNIRATEPLGGCTVWVTLNEVQMYHAFKRQGGILTSAYPESGGGILTKG